MENYYTIKEQQNYKQLSLFNLWPDSIDVLFQICVLPDGVIGNTWAFGAHIPGSSPGRVAF